MGSPSSPLVFDTWALLAHLLDEPQQPRVESLMRTALAERRPMLVSGMSLGEVCYITERMRGAEAAHDVLSGLEDLGFTIVDPDRTTVLSAAHVKARGAISFGDAFVVALALEVDGTVVTGDPEFRKVEDLVSVCWLPPKDSGPAGRCAPAGP